MVVVVVVLVNCIFCKVIIAIFSRHVVKDVKEGGSDGAKFTEGIKPKVDQKPGQFYHLHLI